MIKDHRGAAAEKREVSVIKDHRGAAAEKREVSVIKDHREAAAEKGKGTIRMFYIQEYKEGDRFTGIYLCKSKQILKTKAGKTYYSLLLQDKTGVIDAKIWELNNGIADFDAMDFVMTEGTVTSFQGARQVNIRRLRKAQDGEYDPSEYIPSTKYDIEEMYRELCEIIASLKEPHLKQLAENTFLKDTEFIKEFKIHSAAKAVHHGFVGGLLQHTLAVTKLCDYLSGTYEVLDRDLLLTAAIFHDFAKVYEISEFPKNDYTDDGQLLGHVFLGAEMIGQKIREVPGFPPVLASELRHCILAHHGELEFGSPKKPALAEALALSFADNTDAKLETITEIYDKAEATTEWLGYSRYVESNVRQSSGYIQKKKSSISKKN